MAINVAQLYPLIPLSYGEWYNESDFHFISLQLRIILCKRYSDWFLMYSA